MSNYQKQYTIYFLTETRVTSLHKVAINEKERFNLISLITIKSLYFSDGLLFPLSLFFKLIPFNSEFL